MRSVPLENFSETVISSDFAGIIFEFCPSVPVKVCVCSSRYLRFMFHRIGVVIMGFILETLRPRDTSSYFE